MKVSIRLRRSRLVWLVVSVGLFDIWQRQRRTERISKDLAVKAKDQERYRRFGNVDPDAFQRWEDVL